VQGRWHGLQTSPVSWLGEKELLEGLPAYKGTDLKVGHDKDHEARSQEFARCLPAAKVATVTNEPYIRLTVARRQRFHTVFPSTKSAVVVEGRRPLWVASVGGTKPPG